MRRAGLLLLLCVLGCGADEAEERAQRDLSVGQVASADVTVAVHDGHAVITRFDASAIDLWATAPVWRLDVTRAVPGEMIIAIDNAMPDGTLTATLPITQLAALGTHQRYRVELPAGSSRLTFTTEDADDRGPWRFALLSDVQTAIDEVDDVFVSVNEADVRFLLGAGDLTEDGTPAELVAFKEAMQRSLTVPYYTTLGCHDAPPDTPWHDHFGRANARFRFRDVTFSLLDSASATVAPTVYGWLDTWLAEAATDVHVVAMHIPPLDPVGVRNGAFGSRLEAADLLTRLAGGGVDLTLYGHIHSFYGYDNAGIPAIISGGGGAQPEQLDGVGRHIVVVELGADQGLGPLRFVPVD